MEPDPRATLHAAYAAAVAAAQPARFMADAEIPRVPGRTFVLALGKAAFGMASAARARVEGPCTGLIVTRRGHGGGAPAPFPVVEAGHPVPDAKSLHAGALALAAADGLGPDDLLLALISGGASALCEAVPAAIPLADLQAAAEALLRSGLRIGLMNAARRRMSLIKGGRLATAAWPARTLTLVMSDVPGDRLADVGSGPTAAADEDPALGESALAAAGLAPPPAAIAAWLEDPRSHPPSPDDPRLARAEARLVGSAATALEAAGRVCAAAGYDVIDLGDGWNDDALELGRAHGALALGHAQRPAPVAILSGGETTVRAAPGGRGGRNKAYLLAALIRTAGHARIWGLAADTDGIDGSEDDAGAWFGPDTLDTARAGGRDPARDQAASDSHPFFAAAGALLTPGPTGTNVNDLRILLVTPG